MKTGLFGGFRGFSALLALVTASAAPAAPRAVARRSRAGAGGAADGLRQSARFRFDGSNEVAGVIPDVMTGHRADDGYSLKAKLIAAKLTEAVALARALQP